MITTAMLTTGRANGASIADSTTARTPDNSMPSTADVSTSRTTTGKILAATSTGWAARANTNRPTAKATSAGTAVHLTATADIGMTAATVTTTTGVNRTGRDDQR